MLGLEKRLPRFVDADRRVLVIVEPRALHVLVVKGETERLHKVKRAAVLAQRRMTLPVLGGISG